MPTPAPGPMNPLQVQLFVGAAAGRRARFDRSPITFGRDPANLLVVDDATVSRRHGEIRFEGGMWVLANLSENGTKVNRKNVAEKPVPLKTGDEVFVGGKLLFNVTIEPVEAPPAGEQSMLAMAGAAQGGEPEGTEPKKKKKSMIMYMIPVYVVVLLLLVLFLSTLKGRKGGGVEDSVPELTREQVAKIIAKPLEKETPSDLRYREALAEASRLYGSRERINGRFVAYQKFKEALSYIAQSDGNFPPADFEAQLQYKDLEKDLVEMAYSVYADGCNRLNRGDNAGAYHAFDRLKDMISDGSSELIKNAQAKQNIAAKRTKGKIKPPK